MAKKPQVQRRRKTARATIRKGATLMETPGAFASLYRLQAGVQEEDPLALS